MGEIFAFGEKVDRYDINVFNEREIRASSGILLISAMIVFAYAWFLGNFNPIRIFITISMSDFIIRLFINPRYSPSLILGRLVTCDQTPEYVGAPQKKFAWGIGLALSSFMFYVGVLSNNVNTLVLSICGLCMFFLFLDTSFGICVGCKMYNMFNRHKAKLCPGGVCELHMKEDIQKTSVWQIAALVLFATLIFFASKLIL